MSAGDAASLIGRIPVRNIWLLFLYASDLARFEGRFDARLDEDDADLPALAARLLIHAAERRLRRGLSRGPEPRRAVLTRVRGRIDLAATEAGRLLERGRIACRFEAVTADTPRNRLARFALKRIAPRLAPDLARSCRLLARDLGRRGVSERPPASPELARDVIGRNDAEDRLMVAAARLALDLVLPTEEAGPGAMPLPNRDAVAVRTLFERAVAGFYRAELPPDWRVRRGSPLNWQVEAATPGARCILPAMRADVILDHAPAGRRLVIETKFTDLVVPGWRRERTIASAHLYQIYAYLTSQSGRDALWDSAEGLLLHPAAGADVDETVVIQGRGIRFATVDLAADPAAVRRRLLELALRSGLPRVPAQEKSPTRAPG